MSRQFASKCLVCLIALTLLAAKLPAVAAASADVDAAIKAGDLESATKLLEQELEIRPFDDAKRFQLARILANKEQYSQALAHYEVLVRQHPENVDYSFGRALVLAWMGSDAKALTELTRAKRLAPDYEDVWRLHFVVAQRQKEHDVDLEALRLEAKTRFPQASWWRDPASERKFNWLLSVGGAHEDISDGLPDWNNQFTEISWLRDSDSRYFARLVRDERFDQSDITFAAGGEWQLPLAWFAGMELARSDSPSFQPKNAFMVHVGRSLTNGWGVDFRWRQRKYDTATVSTYTALAERYFGAYRAAYSLNASRLHGEETSLAHVLTLNWYMTDRTSVGLVVATGEEAEAIVPGQVLRSDVTSVTLSGRHILNHRLTLNWWAGTHEQGIFYERRYVGMALSVAL